MQRIVSANNRAYHADQRRIHRLDIPSEELAKKLRIKDVDAAELNSILLSHFTHSQSRAPNQVIYYQSELASFGLALYFKRDLLTRVEAGPGLTIDTLEAIIEKVDSALVFSPGTVVGGKLLFSQYQTRGCHAMGDVLQLRPVPPQSPQPTFGFGSYPCILEFSYKESTDRDICMLRHERKGTELGLLLHILLEGHVKVSPIRTTAHWVLLPAKPDQARQYAYCSVGYPHTGVPSKASQFSDPKQWERVEEVAPQEYYNRTSIELGRGLQVPSNLDKSVRKYRSLDPASRSVFLRSAYWSHTARLAFDYSMSMAYLALVNAVEALISVPKGGPICASCKRPIQTGPTQLFTQFLETYAPGECLGQRERTKLYSTRSSLVHGNAVLFSDTPGPMLLGHPQYAVDLQEFSKISRVVKIALYNWLHAQTLRSDSS